MTAKMKWEKKKKRKILDPTKIENRFSPKSKLTKWSSNPSVALYICPETPRDFLSFPAITSTEQISISLYILFDLHSSITCWPVHHLPLSSNILLVFLAYHSPPINIITTTRVPITIQFRSRLICSILWQSL